MFKLNRETPFWSQPWFMVFAIVAGQVYGGFWMNLGTPQPTYVPSSMVIAAVSDGFEITITAPGIPRSYIRTATN